MMIHVILGPNQIFFFLTLDAINWRVFRKGKILHQYIKASKLIKCPYKISRMMQIWVWVQYWVWLPKTLPTPKTQHFQVLIPKKIPNTQEFRVYNCVNYVKYYPYTHTIAPQNFGYSYPNIYNDKMIKSLFILIYKIIILIKIEFYISPINGAFFAKF